MKPRPERGFSFLLPAPANTYLATLLRRPSASAASHSARPYAARPCVAPVGCPGRSPHHLEEPMPSKSEKQERFMRAVAHDPKFAKKVGVPQKVGREYERADERKRDKPRGRG